MIVLRLLDGSLICLLYATLQRLPYFFVFSASVILFIYIQQHTTTCVNSLGFKTTCGAIYRLSVIMTWCGENFLTNRLISHARFTKKEDEQYEKKINGQNSLQLFYQRVTSVCEESMWQFPELIRQYGVKNFTHL